MSDVKELARKIEGGTVEYDTESGKVRLSPEIIKKYLVSGDPAKVTDAEVFMFLKLCQHQRLNPFLREAYLIKYGDEPATLVVSKDVFVKRASKNPCCSGWEAGVIVRKENGELEYRKGSLVLTGEELVGGWARVYRKDWQVPIEVSVSLNEYIRRKKDGQPMKSWREMPATMIRKVALEQALREAFATDFEGLYGVEEMPVEPQELSKEPVIISQSGEQTEQPETKWSVDTEQANKEEKVVPLPEKEPRTEETQQSAQLSTVIELHNVAVIDDPVIMQSKKGTDYMKVKVIADEGEFEIVSNQKNVMEQIEKGFIFSKVTVKRLSSGMLFVNSIEE
ncbi:phage recombination protein Bet [Caldicellulosiruptor acetigenus]|uniref:phage recombination protein Bet n=1 Tax=Caldicellulosiruptor acetigenus TaxID=301953 RepID=UPI0022A9025F|nr:phage recombination protein Bet [Caldicellulosiruptor acetigenus]WAM37503.1 phage recombination protein Bet [Caldicellulosiruptor acetigenus]